MDMYCSNLQLVGSRNVIKSIRKIVSKRSDLDDIQGLALGALVVIGHCNPELIGTYNILYISLGILIF